jgi:beta-glucosidase
MNLKTTTLSLSIVLTSLTMMACSPSQSSRELPPPPEAKVPDYWPELTTNTANKAEVEARVDALLEKMTLSQKVAQVIQPELRDISVEDMRKYGFGSYLNGGGAFPNNNKHATMQDWVDIAEQMYQASMDDSQDGIAIPTMWGTDAVHGHNNVIGATLFPHNIGLGAMRDPALIERIAEVTAKEVRATGIDWIFAPTVAVARDDRWGRTYESYSEDPAIVGQYAKAIVTGLQGDISDGNIDDHHVISTVKHFIGDGGTQGGDDQGNNISDEETLFRIHAQGYVEGLNAGSQSVMASFNSWHGKKIHGSKYLLTNVLKDKMGFDGFVVGDWNGHGQIDGCTNDNCPQAMNAGLDVYMVPTQAWKPLYNNLIAQVEDGRIPLSRLDDAVRRILRVKIRSGLFDLPSPANRSLSAQSELIGAPEHRLVAQEAVRKSLVMLKNNGNLLPLAPQQHILVAGDGADNIGKQAGGWSITWQGTGNVNADFPGATSIYQGIKHSVEQAGGSVELSQQGDYAQKPDVAIVVFGENPYAEGNGDISNVEYQRGQKTDAALLNKLHQQGIPVVAVFITGRPLWVNPEINASDAFVVAWLPGSEGQGIADVLFTKPNGDINYPMQGKLSFSWPAHPNQGVVNKGDGTTPLFAYGYGLTYGNTPVEVANLPEHFATETTQTQVSHPLYTLSTQKPWSVMLSNGDKTALMNSNSVVLEGVSLRTTDKNIQEDSLLISLTDANAQVGFYSSFPEDLRDYAGAQGALAMEVKYEHPDTQLLVGIECGGDCSTKLPLANFSQATTQWQEVVIPTQCFIEKGANMAEVFASLVLSAQQDTQVTISNIRYLSNASDNPSCP